MKKISLATVALFSFLVGVAPAAAEGSGTLIPLDQGRTWTYEGRAQWTITTVRDSMHQNRIRHGAVRWTMRVLKSDSRHGTIAALVAGFPLEFAWDNPASEPGYAVVIEDEKGIFFEGVDSQKDGEAIARQALDGAAVGDQILRFPVHAGECVGKSASMPPKNHYCWFVRRRVQQAEGLAWEVVFYTLPDEQTVYVIPGVGISRFTYRHHGTLMSLDVSLRESHEGAAL